MKNEFNVEIGVADSKTEFFVSNINTNAKVSDKNIISTKISSRLKLETG